MKRFRTLPVWLVILLLMVGLGLASTSSAKRSEHGRDRLTRLEHQLGDLDLADETRSAIYAIIDQARTEQRDTRRQLREAYKALRTLLEHETPDETEVMAQAEAIGTLQTAYRKQSLRTLLAVHAHLTPEQRADLRQAMQHHGDRHHRRGR